MPNLVIWGAGGHGRVVLDIALAMSSFDRVVFYDDQAEPGQTLAGIEVLSGGIAKACEQGIDYFVAAIGANQVRARCFAQARSAGLVPVTCVHPTAWISPRATIGPGTVVMPRAVIQTDAEIGIDCIINTGAIIEHDCRIGDHAHLSPAVALSGNVTVGEYTHMGTGAVAIPGTRIGPRCVIGAGAVVISEIPSDATAVGVPAVIRS